MEKITTLNVAESAAITYLVKRFGLGLSHNDACYELPNEGEEIALRLLHLANLMTKENPEAKNANSRDIDLVFFTHMLIKQGRNGKLKSIDFDPNSSIEYLVEKIGSGTEKITILKPQTLVDQLNVTYDNITPEETVSDAQT